MSSCYILAVSCELHRTIDNALIEVLEYMTRTQDYDFHPPQHPLFDGDFQHERFLEDGTSVKIWSSWRTFIANQPRGGEDFEPYGEFYSYFRDFKLEVRRLIRDDSFSNAWYIFSALLASVSQSSGFIGYHMHEVICDPRPTLTLIYFDQGLVMDYPITLVSNSSELSSERQYESLKSKLPELSELILQALEFQARRRGISFDSYLDSAFIHKELFIPKDLQQEWAWH